MKTRHWMTNSRHFTAAVHIVELNQSLTDNNKDF